MKKRNLFILMILMMSLLLMACAPASSNNADSAKNGVNEQKQADNADKTDSKMDAKKILKVGMECAYPPYNWTQVDDSNGAVKIDGSNEYAAGYDVEIAKKVAQALDMELVVVKTGWTGLIPAVNNNIIDVVMAGMTETPARAQEVDFSMPYYSTKLVVITKADSAYANVKTLADFKDAKITAQLGTLHYDVLNQLEGAKIETALPDFTALRLALNSGSIDAYVGEEVEGISSKLVFDNFKVIEFPDKEGFKVDETGSELVTVSVGMKKGSELKDKINEVIKGMSLEEQKQIMIKALENMPAAN